MVSAENVITSTRKNVTNMSCLQFLDGTEKTTNKYSDVANHKWESSRMAKPLHIYQGGWKTQKKDFQRRQNYHLIWLLQLYIKVIRLQEGNGIKDSFVFRMGELHVVFCVLKVIGKLIDGSGYDKVFNEAGR